MSLKDANPPSSSSHSIVIVDDEMELASLFKTFLTNVGYSAISFSDPLLALEYFKETPHNHSILITDMRMPGICGIELAKKIREENDKIKIFLMTAFDIVDLKNHPDYNAAKIDRLIQKPVRFSELREMINHDLKN